MVIHFEITDGGNCDKRIALVILDYIICPGTA